MGKYDGIECAIEDCGAPAITRGWCNRHYIAWKRHGDPLAVLPLFNRSKADRFWSFLAPAPALACWFWTGGCGRGGYGQFAGRVAHRFSYELLIGSVPAGLELDHLCRQPACVNPYHLDPVTPAENIRRMRLARAV